MNILVCISKVPDTTSKIKFKENDTQFVTDGVQFIVNPYDEWYALVRALELKEANGGNVTVINVGKADNDPTIRKALAIGADAAVRIDADPTDAFQVAALIANYAEGKGFNLILLGKETIDYNGSQVGGMIAGLMNLPYVSLATKLDVNGSISTIERDIKGGTEIVEVDGPLVLSAAKGMAEQRTPNMRGIMAARTKPLEVVSPGMNEALTTIVKFELPPEKGAVRLIDADNPQELIQLLHNEAKVI